LRDHGEGGGGGHQKSRALLGERADGVTGVPADRIDAMVNLDSIATFVEAKEVIN
jgi:hypothetical protein